MSRREVRAREKTEELETFRIASQAVASTRKRGGWKPSEGNGPSYLEKNKMFSASIRINGQRKREEKSEEQAPSENALDEEKQEEQKERLLSRDNKSFGCF